MDALTSTVFAKLIAIPAAFMISGYGTSFSQSTVPLLYTLPAATSTPLFTQVYYNGAKFVAPGAILSTTAFAYLAYTAPTKQERNLYVGAAALMVSTQLWTAGVMLGGINRLIEISKAAGVEQEKAKASGEVQRLMAAWVRQNWVRAALGFSGGLVGLWTVLTGRS